MFCKNCGMEIDDQANVCPNCGAEQQAPQAEPQAQPAPQPAAQPAPQQAAPAPAPQAPAKKGVNGLGIAGFVVGLLSLGLGFLYCIFPIVGLALSATGMGLSKRFSSCNGLAIAGLVLSIVGLLIWGIIWIAAASIIASIL